MYIQNVFKHTPKKSYKSVLLVENFREKGKVKHRVISNLSKWPEHVVIQLESLIKGKSVVNLEDFEYTQGKSCGGLIIANEIAKRVGITQALGNQRQGKLGLIQVIGRLLTQGSRLYIAKEWGKDYAIDEVFGTESFDEDDLYENLDWLSENQAAIETKIFQYRHKNTVLPEIYLYDVTSTYFEGTENELADYGYNRDGKKGKKQIVAGLLCDKKGYPVSIEVFEGNTNDTKTVSNQLLKLKQRFGVERVVFVGDKGMIKKLQIDQITSDEFKWNYITSITKAQIESLLEQDIIQLGIFDEDITEVANEGTRYILRRNPVRVSEMENSRNSKIEKIKRKTEEKNQYLEQHPRAKAITAQKQILVFIKKLKVQKFMDCKIEENKIKLEIADKLEMKEINRLDGCYVIKTDLPKECGNSQEIHSSYKNLALVESAFRAIKTTMEEIQPVYVRKESRTRGHVFVCMLAYLILKYIDDFTSSLDLTKRFVIDTLNQISYINYSFGNQKIKALPNKLHDHQEQILQALTVKLPKYL